MIYNLFIKIYNLFTIIYNLFILIKYKKNLKKVIR